MTGVQTCALPISLIGRISLGNERRGHAADGIGIGAVGLGADVFAILEGYQGFGESDNRRGLDSSWIAVPNERGGGLAKAFR